jgi:hypothetical protein
MPRPVMWLYTAHDGAPNSNLNKTISLSCRLCRLSPQQELKWAIFQHSCSVRGHQSAQAVPDGTLGPTKSIGGPLVRTALRSRLGGTPGSSALSHRSKKSRAWASRSSSGEALVYVPVTPKLPSAWPAWAAATLTPAMRSMSVIVVWRIQWALTPSSAAHARHWMRRAKPSNHLSLRWPPSCRCRTSGQPLWRREAWETRRPTR